MKCRECGNDIPDGSAFCNFCGKEQGQEASKGKYILIGAIGGFLIAAVTGGWLLLSSGQSYQDNNAIPKPKNTAAATVLKVENKNKEDEKAAEKKAAEEKEQAEEKIKNDLIVAKKHLIAKKYEDALKVVTDVIKRNPNLYEAYIIRGQANYNINKGKEAVLDFNKAIAIKKDCQEAYYQKGYILMEYKEFKEAIDCFSESLKLKPLDADTFKNRGFAFMMLQDYTNAEKDLEKAASLNNVDKKAHKYLGDTLYYEKKYKEAVSAYDRALAIDPEYEIAKKNKYIADRAKVAAKGGLDILGKMTHEELAVIAKPMLEKHFEQISKYPNINDDYTAYSREIGEDLRKFAGRTVANMSRGEGVQYREMLIDTCKNYQKAKERKVDFSDTDKEIDIEIALLKAVSGKSEFHKNDLGDKILAFGDSVMDTLVDDVVTPAVIYIVKKRYEYCNMKIEL